MKGIKPMLVAGCGMLDLGPASGVLGLGAGRSSKRPIPQWRDRPPTSREIPSSKPSTIAMIGVNLAITATMISDDLRRYSMISDEFGPEKIKKSPMPEWQSASASLRRDRPAARATRSGRCNPAEVARVRGWQNEAKTKPKGDAVRGINGLAGFVKRPDLQGKGAFQPVLRRRVVSRGKLQNEATDTGMLPGSAKVAKPNAQPLFI
jgi:hypothetical protein